MRFRKDLPYLMIPLTYFQPFDHGEKIEALFPKGWDLSPEDMIFWECAQFDGIALVKECKIVKGEQVCALVKIS